MPAPARRIWFGSGALRLGLAALLVATVGCDRVTKRMAATGLSSTGAQSLLGDTVRLEYTENVGGFLSLGAAWPAPLRAVAFLFGNGLVLACLVLVAFGRRLPAAALAGLTLMAAGGASNLLDRLARGRVVDFMNVGVQGIRTGIFNVADVAILAGAMLFVFSESRSWRRSPRTP
jgi:signal peptidase II